MGGRIASSLPLVAGPGHDLAADDHHGADGDLARAPRRARLVEGQGHGGEEGGVRHKRAT
jgi:hypothetical protein